MSEHKTTLEPSTAEEWRAEYFRRHEDAQRWMGRALAAEAREAEIARLRAAIELIRQDAWTHPADYETDRRMRLERIADRIRALSEAANEF